MNRYSTKEMETISAHYMHSLSPWQKKTVSTNRWMIILILELLVDVTAAFAMQMMTVTISGLTNVGHFG